MGVLEKLLKIDRNGAIVMASDMLMAGIDTVNTFFFVFCISILILLFKIIQTGSVTINFLYMLAKNPEKQRKLREEILKIMPQKDSILTMDSLNNIPYLRACLKEVIRLNPILMGNMRGAGCDLVLKGYQIPKGVSGLPPKKIRIKLLKES